MAPRTDRTTRIPSGVASPVTANHAAKESVFVDLRNAGNLEVVAGLFEQIEQSAVQQEDFEVLPFISTLIPS